MNRNDLWRCAAIFALAAAPQLSAHADDDDRRAPKSTMLSIPLTGMAVQASVTFSAPSPVLTSTSANTTVKSGTITVGNVGTGQLTLSAAPTITKTDGPAGGSFSITGGSCTAGVVVAAGGGTCTIVVQYTPSNARVATARVTLTDVGAAQGKQSSASFNGN
jgi:hypothetical protein